MVHRRFAMAGHYDEGAYPLLPVAGLSEVGLPVAGRVWRQRHRCLNDAHPVAVIGGVLADPVRLDSVEAGCQYSTSRAPDRLQKHGLRCAESTR